MKTAQASYPITVSPEDLHEIVNKLFSGKRWKEFEITSSRIELEPYYLFEYLAVSTEKKESKEKAEEEAEEAEEEFSGSLALNALTNELDESIPGLLEGIQAIKASDLKKAKETEKANETELSVLEPKLSLQEAEKIILLKLSKQLNVSREDIVILNPRLALIPFYLVQASFNESEALLKIDALQGNVFEGDEEIPFNPKTSQDLFAEALADLKNPVKLAEYFLNLIKWLALKIVSLIKYFFSSQRRMLVLLLIIVALLLFFYATGLIK